MGRGWQGKGLLEQRRGRSLVRVQVAQRPTREADRLRNLAAQKNQINPDVFPDPVGQDEGGIDASAEDVQAAGCAGNILQGEIWSGGGLMAYNYESAHRLLNV